MCAQCVRRRWQGFQSPICCLFVLPTVDVLASSMLCISDFLVFALGGRCGRSNSIYISPKMCSQEQHIAKARARTHTHILRRLHWLIWVNMKYVVISVSFLIYVLVWSSLAQLMVFFHAAAVVCVAMRASLLLLLLLFVMRTSSIRVRMCVFIRMHALRCLFTRHLFTHANTLFCVCAAHRVKPCDSRFCSFIFLLAPVWFVVGECRVMVRCQTNWVCCRYCCLIFEI